MKETNKTVGPCENIRQMKDKLHGRYVKEMNE